MRFRVCLSMLLLNTMFICGQSNNSNEYFYYYKGEQTNLSIDSSRLFVVTYGMLELPSRNSFSDIIINDYGISHAHKAVRMKSNEELLAQTRLSPIYMGSVGLIDDINEVKYKKVVDSLNAITNVLQVLPSFILGGQRVDVTNNFYVKLQSHEDLHLLEGLADNYGISIIGNNEYMPLWYTLSCTRTSELNSIEAANLFYESGLFEFSEPEFSYCDLAQSNDTYYPMQWGINNTGQYNIDGGFDINVLDAWKMAKGNGVKVAVYDHGIELTHPDLIENVSSFSFDANSNSSPSWVRGSHGTACAGIIGAVQNNGKGITGVAPEAELISISLRLKSSDTPQQIANGFNWAWKNGADVISNSWGGYARSSIIDDAILETLTKGRDRKGTVIVFAAGNSQNQVADVKYPGNLFPKILVVGGISYNGERKTFTSPDGEQWQSCYGERLDVVAPCVQIYTTDLGGASGYSDDDYDSSFNGTSSACPHVAGVAALVLSVNPNLTAEEVCDIIEATARKVRTDLYSYTNVEDRTNGKWNNQMGYGLVDAASAVEMALDKDCRTIYVSNDTISGVKIINGCNVKLKYVEIKNNSEVVINATEKVMLNPITKISKGARVVVYPVSEN